MPADPTPYRSERLAEAYALHRPPLHAAIWNGVVASGALGTARLASALDVGCGAGASTAPLMGHTASVTGLDASEAMLHQARSALPGATFVLGTVEALPFDAAAFDLISAAGCLNYAEPHTALGELARVLRPGGRLVAYDFSTGRPLVGAAKVEAAFGTFRREFPPLAGYSLDLRALPCDAHGLEPVAYETFALQASMDATVYVEYLLGETNVDAAIAAGATKAQARAICRDLFEPLLDGEARSIGFSAVFAIARKACG